jgi:hypothetical protein
MDRLRIDIEPAPVEIYTDREGNQVAGGGGAFVMFAVNDEPLRSLVEDCERPYATASRQAHLAGDYAPLWTRGSFPWSALLGVWYEQDYLLSMERATYCPRIVLMGCGCGMIGCWPLLVRITVEDERVVWSDFAQPHRRRWKYDRLGPFTFDRSEYEATLAQAEQTFAETATDAPGRDEYERLRAIEDLEERLEALGHELAAGDEEAAVRLHDQRAWVVAELAYRRAGGVAD